MFRAPARNSPSSPRGRNTPLRLKARLSYFTAHKINPYTTLAAVPNTITGPATVNIFTAVPVTTPSACVKIGTREIFALFYWVFGSSNF